MGLDIPSDNIRGFWVSCRRVYNRVIMKAHGYDSENSSWGVTFEDNSCAVAKLAGCG